MVLLNSCVFTTTYIGEILKNPLFYVLTEFLNCCTFPLDTDLIFSNFMSNKNVIFLEMQMELILKTLIQRLLRKKNTLKNGSTIRAVF